MRHFRHSVTGRSAAIVALSLMLIVPPLAAQRDDRTMGSVVRVVTTRSGAVGARQRRSGGAGMLIRRRGELQRVDMLDAIDDTAGREWISLQNAPLEMRVNDVGRRSSLVMRFEDLRTTFTSLLQVRFDSVQAEAEVLGAGPKLLGYDTRRVRIRRGFRMQTARGGKSQVVRVTSETDALVAPAVPEAYGSNSALSLTSGSTSAMVEQIFGPGAGELVMRGREAMPQGLTLRAVSRTRTESSGTAVFPLGPEGATQEAVDSVEVVSIEQRPLPDALFAVPDGYTVVDFSSELRKVIAMVDSLGTALGGGKGSKPVKTSKPTGKPYKP